MQYDLKWKNDLAVYVKTFGSFVFEGNVNDLQPSDGDDIKYRSLEETIAERYGDEYCVVFFDHTRSSGKPVDDDSDEGGGESDADDPFNSFKIYSGSQKIFGASGERIESPNIALFKEYYKSRYLDALESEANNSMKGGMTTDMRRILDAMREFKTRTASPEYAEAKPFMFVLPKVSRYMTVPGRPSDREHAVLLLLFAATQLTDSPCRLLLFVDKMNDLPTWFESENSNSALKKIFIPVPDGEFRKAFYKRELQGVMTVDGDEDEKIKKFAAYTENYSLRRLLQLCDYIKSDTDDGVLSRRRLENIDKTVMGFDVGQNRNPWRAPELKNRVRNMPATLGNSVKGQDSAIARVSAALKAAVTGVSSSKKNDRRPRAVFFFAGPTGTGKTELTKAIAESVFGREDKMIRFDMSEFREEHSDARLFGAPPGYVGYEAGGELTKAIKQDPFSIVLFDEIEKAAPRIWDKFLQILGDGRLTDGKGETVSFTQSVIIFTSNLGITADACDNDYIRAQRDAQAAELDKRITALEGEINAATGDKKIELIGELRKLYLARVPLVGLTQKTMGDYLFQRCYRELKQFDPVYAFNEFVRDSVSMRVKAYFDNIGRREVMGRIGEDNILVFNFIAPKTAREIADTTMQNYVKTLKNENDSHPEITVTPAAAEFIKNAVVQPEILDFGGREIVMCVENLMKKPVSDYLFDHDGVGLKITLDVSGGNLVAV